MKRFSFLLALAIAASSALAEDEQSKNVEKAIKAFEEGIELLEDGKLDAGAEEIRWGLELVDKAKQGGIDKLLIDELNDYKGGEITTNKVMGMSVTERVYTKDGMTIRVTLTRKTADSGGGLLQGFGTIAKFGMMQGERVRIGGRTGSAMKQGRESTVSLELEDSSILAFISSVVGLDGVIEFAEEYPVRKINDAVSDSN